MRSVLAFAGLCLAAVTGCGASDGAPDNTSTPAPALGAGQAIDTVRGYHAALQQDDCKTAGTYVRRAHARALTHKLTCDALVKKYEAYPPAARWSLSVVDMSGGRTVVGGVVAGFAYKFAVTERDGSPVLLTSSQRKAG